MTSGNTTTVQLGDGREVCLSYGTPVAAHIPGRGYVFTDKYYSVTTSRHVTNYTSKAGTKLPHAEFMALVAPLTEKVR